jgi:hypothetical protein
MSTSELHRCRSRERHCKQCLQEPSQSQRGFSWPHSDVVRKSSRGYFRILLVQCAPGSSAYIGDFPDSTGRDRLCQKNLRALPEAFPLRSALFYSAVSYCWPVQSLGGEGTPQIFRGSSSSIPQCSGLLGLTYNPSSSTLIRHINVNQDFHSLVQFNCGGDQRVMEADDGGLASACLTLTTNVNDDYYSLTEHVCCVGIHETLLWTAIRWEAKRMSLSAQPIRTALPAKESLAAEGRRPFQRNAQALSCLCAASQIAHNFLTLKYRGRVHVPWTCLDLEIRSRSWEQSRLLQQNS